jgi:hypothetical protein
MTTKPKTRKATAKPTDPVFAAIAEQKAMEKEWLRHVRELEDAERAASKTHGERPDDWIQWRIYFHRSEWEIDNSRKIFLRRYTDHEQIEQEYLDAKARFAAAIWAGDEWDQRTGVKPLREQLKRAGQAERRAAMRMARTKPTTSDGAITLINYARRDLSGGDWQLAALKTVAASLKRGAT